MIPVTLTALDRAFMQAAAAAQLPDRCIILRFVEGSVDSRGLPAPSFTRDASETACSITPGGQRERGNAGEQLPIRDAAIRFALGTAITNQDCVIVVSMLGVADSRAETDRVYHVSDPPRVWNAAVTMSLKQVYMAVPVEPNVIPAGSWMGPRGFLTYSEQVTYG